MSDTMPSDEGRSDSDGTEEDGATSASGTDTASGASSGDAPDPKKLGELDEHIGHARTTAEEVVGASDEEPLYAESGSDESADDQTITPPG